MANNVKALVTIKNELLNVVFGKLLEYKFKCLVPINLTKLRLFYSQFYARSIGTKGGRNSGLAFLFESQDGQAYAITIKRHRNPNYSQWDFDTIVPLPNDFLLENDTRVKETHVVLTCLDAIEYLHNHITVGKHAMTFLYAFDMIEEEYFTGSFQADFLYFIIKNTVVDEANSDRLFYGFFTGSVAQYDAEENVSERHYTFMAAGYIYDSNNFSDFFNRQMIDLADSIARLPY